MSRPGHHHPLRVHLAAIQLTFHHPVRGTDLTIEAPLSEDLALSLEQRLVRAGS